MMTSNHLFAAKNADDYRENPSLSVSFAASPSPEEADRFLTGTLFTRRGLIRNALNDNEFDGALLSAPVLELCACTGSNDC